VIRATLSRHIVLFGSLVGFAQLSSCGAPSSYMGIDLQPGAAPSELRTLAMRARAGDKQAQLELGSAFEAGQLTPINLRAARRLYSQAASDTGGTIWVYQPPVGNSSGRVLAISRAPNSKGLTEARRRLEMLSKKVTIE
jgi:hypothetical protein